MASTSPDRSSERRLGRWGWLLRRKPLGWRAQAVRLVLLYALFLGIGLPLGLADFLLLHPSRGALRMPSSSTRQAIPTAAGRLDVCVHVRPHEGDRPLRARVAVLHFTGNGSRAEIDQTSVLHAFPKDANVTVWSVNYPGFGQSDGRGLLRELPPAALAAWDAFEPGARAQFDVVLVSGSSLGTAVALHVASQRSPDGVLLRDPVALSELILQANGWWNLWLLSVPVSFMVPDALQANLSAPRCQMPAAIFMTVEDNVVPHRWQQHAANLYAGPKKTLSLTKVSHTEMLWVTLEDGETNPQFAEGRDILGWLLAEIQARRAATQPGS